MARWPGAPGAAGRPGSRTRQAIASQASTDSPASTPKPQRQLLRSISQASGVAVASTPRPLRLITRPEMAVKRSGAKCRPMNTVHTRKAGAQPAPISACPSSSTPKLPACEDSSAPATANGSASRMVRRTPHKSSDTPMASCMAPNAK